MHDDITPQAFRTKWQWKGDLRLARDAQYFAAVVIVRSGGNLELFRQERAALEAEIHERGLYRIAVAQRRMREVAKEKHGRVLEEFAAELRAKLLLDSLAKCTSERGRVNGPLDDDDEWEEAVEPAATREAVAVSDIASLHIVDPGINFHDSGEKRSAFRASTGAALREPHRLLVHRDRNRADRIAADLLEYAPWLSSVVDALWRDMLACVGSPIVVRPTVIVGPAGCGKTAFAQRFAEEVGLPFSRLEMSSANAVFDITGSEFSWAESQIGEPLSLIARSKSASVLMILDEVEKAGRTQNGGDPLQALLPLLERRTAKTFRSPWLGCQADLSNVSWLMTANERGRLPRPLLDRCRVIEVGMPTGENLRRLVRGVVGLDDDDVKLVERLCAGVEEGSMSLRGLQRIAAGLKEFENRPVLH